MSSRPRFHGIAAGEGISEGLSWALFGVNLHRYLARDELVDRIRPALL